MRQMIKGLVAAFAVMTAGAASPAMACGYGGLWGVGGGPPAPPFHPGSAPTHNTLSRAGRRPPWNFRVFCYHAP